jgi:excisionase family DNA binding protein
MVQGNGNKGGMAFSPEEAGDLLAAAELARLLSQPAIEKLYTVRQAAELLGMHPESVYREIRADNIRVEKLGPRRTRIAESELARFVAERTREYGRV